MGFNSDYKVSFPMFTIGGFAANTGGEGNYAARNFQEEFINFFNSLPQYLPQSLPQSLPQNLPQTLTFSGYNPSLMSPLLQNNFFSSINLDNFNLQNIFTNTINNPIIPNLWCQMPILPG